MKFKNYYQYQPPVAMFSMAQLDQNEQANFGIVNAIKEPFRRFGRRMADKIEEAGIRKAEDLIKRAPTMTPEQQQKALEGLQGHARAHNWVKANPGKAGALGVGANVLGAGVGAGLIYGGSKIFTRRRRTKNGKVVVEQVRR